jgi:hypothetical protein
MPRFLRKCDRPEIRGKSSKPTEVYDDEFVVLRHLYALMIVNVRRRQRGFVPRHFLPEQGCTQSEKQFVFQKQ